MLWIKLGLECFVAFRVMPGKDRGVLALSLRWATELLSDPGTGFSETWKLFGGLEPLSAADVGMGRTGVLDLG
jgi:hypothetical protein